MRAIVFVCTQTIALPATTISATIADVARWREFQGYGFLPGIASAEYEQRTSNMVGSRVRVRNTDGSAHCEEFCVWEAGQRIVLKLDRFTPPLHALATHFIEEWRFEARGNSTFVTRKFELFPKRAAARPLLWGIARFFQRAIIRQLAQMAAAAEAAQGIRP